MSNETLNWDRFIVETFRKHEFSINKIQLSSKSINSRLGSRQTVKNVLYNHFKQTIQWGYQKTAWQITTLFVSMSMTPGWFLCSISFSGLHLANYVFVSKRQRSDARLRHTKKKNIPEMLTKALPWNLIPDIKVFISFVFFIRFSRCAFIIKILFSRSRPAAVIIKW